MQKLIIFSVLVMTTYAAAPRPAPAPYNPPPPAPYSPPRPTGYKPVHEKPEPPKPYAYEYGVADQHSGTDFKKVESQNEYGAVQGEYRVNLPDGRIQIVRYTADHEGGFIADVQYEGEAHYPEYKPQPYKPQPKPYAPPRYPAAA